MGFHDMTEGEMTLFEKPYRPSSSREAEEAGVAIIMQQPNFAFNLTVAENIFLGRDKTFLNKAGWHRLETAERGCRGGFTRIPLRPHQADRYCGKSQI